jgi:hypothetical protein
MRLMILTVAAMLCGAAVASAQTSPGSMIAPADPSPSTSDTRKIDQARVPLGGTSTPTNGSINTQENWRSSSGLNSDPNNASGAPGTGSGLGTSPTR